MLILEQTFNLEEEIIFHFLSPIYDSYRNELNSECKKTGGFLLCILGAFSYYHDSNCTKNLSVRIPPYGAYRVENRTVHLPKAVNREDKRSRR